VSLPPFPAAAAAVREQAARYRERWGSTPYHPGHCPACGADTVFFCHDLALAREAMTCAECGTTSRYRSLARGLLRAVHDLAGVQAPDLASLARVPLSRRIAVYDTQVPFHYAVCSYPLPELLDAASWIDVQTSRYDPALPWGAELGPNSTNQDLERLTFPDESFDVVLTSDVMEHVRNPERAHAEIARVLRPGGVYLFTVPHTRGAPTLERVRVHDPDDESKDELLMEPEYHGDGNSDTGRVLSYRVFGTDLDEDLAALGLTLEYAMADDPAAGIVNTELFYCRKA
jgi:SAM-dependent methyltransferase